MSGEFETPRMDAVFREAQDFQPSEFVVPLRVGRVVEQDLNEARKIAQEGRLAGRQEAFAILMSLNPEDIDDYIKSRALADTGDYVSYWDEPKLREFFDVQPGQLISMLDRTEAAFCKAAFDLAAAEQQRDSIAQLLTEVLDKVMQPGGVWFPDEYRAKLAHVMEGGGGMTGYATASILGRLVRDPELKELAGGHRKLNVSLAINTRHRNGDGEVVKEVTYLEVTFWDRKADILAPNLRKGDPFVCTATLQLEEFTVHRGKPEERTEKKLRLRGDDFWFLPSGRQEDRPAGGDPRGGRYNPAPVPGTGEPMEPLPGDDDQIDF